MNGVIYKIVSPSCKVYIGQTTSYDKRMSRYKNHSCKQQRKLYASLVKYGFVNHKVEVLESNIKCYQLLNEKECFYIEFYNSMIDGLNLTKGGRNHVVMSPESIERMRMASLGNKNNIGKKNALGYKHTDDAKKKISQSRKGVPSPIKGKKLSKQHCFNISKSKYIKVGQYTIENELLAVFSSLKEASIITKISIGNISSVIANKRKSAGGFIWKKIY